MTRPKLLISAFNCSPNRGSEDEVGYQWILGHLNKNKFQIFVLTEERYKSYLKELIANKNLNFIFHTIKLINISKVKSNFILRLYYYIWQLTAYFKIKKEFGINYFNIIHHVTWGSMRWPILLSNLKSVFIIGPIGGGVDTPSNLFKGFTIWQIIVEKMRTVNNRIINLSPLVNQMFKNSAIVYAANLETKQIILKKYHPKVQIMSVVGLGNQDVFNNQNKEKKLKIVFLGRLIYWKGIYMILDILNKIDKSIKYKMFFIGEGNELNKILSFKKKFPNIDIEIKSINNKRVIKFLSDKDILLFPSYRESGGLAILEAIKAGVKVICLDLGGPKLLVDENNGYKINIENKSFFEISNEIAKMINHLK